jgi:hypothetical protein
MASAGAAASVVVVVVAVVSAAFSPQAASRPRLATAARVKAVFILEISV